jgi:hypothetical protein
MKRAASWRRPFAAAVACAVLAGSAMWPVARAADEKEKEPPVRLPPYYSKVVTPEQREKIYALQRASAERIAALERELASVKAKLDSDIADVLTPQQRAEVNRLRTEAEAKRIQKKEAEKRGARPPAGKKPGQK